MAEKWIGKAVQHPGAATESAKRAGLSLGEWITKHRHEGGTAGHRARLAAWFRKRARKSGQRKAVA